MENGPLEKELVTELPLLLGPPLENEIEPQPAGTSHGGKLVPNDDVRVIFPLLGSMHVFSPSLPPKMLV